MKIIDHNLLNNALSFYTSCGYQYVETPWHVSDDAIFSTCPTWVKPLKSTLGNLVASGEQGLVELILQGKLFRGKYVCLTPCFRDDPLDEYHQKQFWKVELMHYGIKNEQSLLLDAYNFFSMYCETEICKTDLGFDLVHKPSNVELGSYGVRQYNDIIWTYGTGIAEPRLSQLLKEYKCQKS